MTLQASDPRVQPPAGRTGRNTERPNPTARTVRGNTRLDDLATVYAYKTLEPERSVLSAGWRDPAGLVEGACDTGLGGSHFVDPRHSFQFWYLCRCAELNHLPTIGEALTVATTCADVYLDLDDLDATLWHCDALPSSMLPTLAEVVVENARNRERAQACLHEAVTILNGTIGFDFDIIIRPRSSGRERRP